MTVSVNIIVTVGIGVVVTIMGYLLKKSIFEKMDGVAAIVNNLNEKFTDFEKDVIKDYVRKEDFCKNETAHEKMWIELNGTKQRVTALETLKGLK